MADVPLPVPWWVEILNMAEEWSTPPWDILWDHGKVVWALRWRVYNDIVNTAQRDKEKHS